MDARILNVGIRWTWMVTFTPASGTHWIGGYVSPKTDAEAVGKRKKLNHCPCQGSSSR